MIAAEALCEVLELATSIETLSTSSSVRLLASRIRELVEDVSSEDAAEEPTTSKRELSMTPSARRARQRRLDEKNQLKLPTMDGGRSMAATAVATAVDRTGTDLALSKDPDPNVLKIRKGSPRATAVVHEREQPPSWAFEDAATHRPDLAEWDVRTMWRRFATKHPDHVTEADARAHHTSWLKRQDVGRYRNRDAAEYMAPEQADQPELEDDAPMSGIAFGDIEPLMPIEMRRELAKAQLAEMMEREATGPPCDASAVA